MSANDGGPAFPTPATLVTEDSTRADTRRYYGAEDGMSLRDWFAGRALQGIISDGESYRMTPNENIADYAYRLADAMLAARSAEA